MRRQAELEAALLGLLHGPAELLPVSSSGHAAAVPWLLGWEVADWPPERRKELEVALHAGTALALARDLLPSADARALVALASAPAGIAGLLGEDWVQSRLGGPGTLPAGLAAGAAALVLADRCRGRRRGPMTARDAVWLGLAQATALIPGISRTGATLSAARARGYRRPDASRLSFAVAGPVLLGATALKGARVAAASQHGDRAALAAATVSSFASTFAARRVIGVERRRPLWPWAVERAALAAAILAVRYRRRQ